MLAKKQVNAEQYLSWFDVSPDGKRLIIAARGDVFSVPAEEGVTRNFTQSDGAADRTPAWSPDGKSVAYWSDANGEYQLWIYDVASGSTKNITNYTSGFKYQLFWSPDSKKMAFVNQAMEFNYFDITTKTTVKVDKGRYLFHGSTSAGFPAGLFYPRKCNFARTAR